MSPAAATVTVAAPAGCTTGSRGTSKRTRTQTRRIRPFSPLLDGRKAPTQRSRERISYPSFQRVNRQNAYEPQRLPYPPGASLDDAGAQGLRHRVGARGDTEPLVEALDVRLHGLDGHAELLTDLAVAESSRQEEQ